MIKSNLRKKLLENNVRITKVFNDTGISRSTLTMLADGVSKGIQFDTLNTLCKYLKIEPSELFIYSPIDLDVTIGELSYNSSGFDFPTSFGGVIYLNFDTPTGRVSDELIVKGKLDKGEFIIIVESEEDNPNYLPIFKGFPRELYTYCTEMITTKILHDYFSWCEGVYLDTTPIEHNPQRLILKPDIF